jgi:iron complex transport system ATP-binding protein
MNSLVLNEVSVTRAGRPVLKKVSVQFKSGRLTAVIGPNGSGKSTLLSVAAGLLPAAAGTVSLGSSTLAQIGRKSLATRRAYLPQNPHIDWPISVERLVALGLTPVLPIFGGLPPLLTDKIDRALAACDILDLRERIATSLSGGEFARAMLARATVGDPELLIVDEPTAGLDPRHAIDAALRLRAFADSGGMVVMAIHDLALAIRFADDVVAIRDGMVHAAGNADAVFVDEVLAELFDVDVQIRRDAQGATVRFLGG